MAVRNVISDLEGSYALAVLWADAPTSLVVARRQAPLIIGLGEGEFICASDTPAIANFTNIILPMEDEEIALLTPLGIEIYDSNNERQYRSPVSLKVSEQLMDKMNFKHYMLKEIYDQPETAKNWLKNYLIKNSENNDTRKRKKKILNDMKARLFFLKLFSLLLVTGVIFLYRFHIYIYLYCLDYNSLVSKSILGSIQ